MARRRDLGEATVEAVAALSIAGRPVSDDDVLEVLREVLGGDVWDQATGIRVHMGADGALETALVNGLISFDDGVIALTRVGRQTHAKLAVERVARLISEDE